MEERSEKKKHTIQVNIIHILSTRMTIQYLIQSMAQVTIFIS